MSSNQTTLDGSRLKGSVRVSRSQPVGHYKNGKIELYQEFFLDEHSFEDITATLTQKIREWLDRPPGV